MIQSDTIKLLRECDAGVKMGVDSINDVYDRVSSPALKNYLNRCKDEHIKLEKEIQSRLVDLRDDGKRPHPLATGMSKMKTGMKMALDGSDNTVASLMTDGCNMGVKSLNRYLNEYKAADEYSKDIAKRLIHLEESLTKNMRSFL